MTGFVLDASIALAWCFDDEATEATTALRHRVRDEGACAPALWPLEVVNVLLHAERRGRLSGPDVQARVDLLRALPIGIDQESSARAWSDLLILARAQALTVYDAAYLDLALRRGLPLATKDKALRDAAMRLRVETVL
jgi:predicted nucleic acid-binding protein